MAKSSQNRNCSSTNPFLPKPFELPKPLDNGFERRTDKHCKKPGKFGHAPYRRDTTIGRKHLHNN